MLTTLPSLGAFRILRKMHGESASRSAIEAVGYIALEHRFEMLADADPGSMPM